jgi:uncharacterized protein (TIGR02284 family)
MINDYEATSPMDSERINNGTDNFAGDTMSNDDVVSCLNELIETCKDGQEGFKQAAEGVERSDLKSLFFEFSQQRAHFAGELQSLVQTLGSEPETTGSTAGALHRGWINLKSALTGKDEKAILNECERGEDSAKSTYKDALEKNLPSNIADVVRNQFDSVKMAHDRVKALRDSYEAADNNETGTTDTGRSNTASTRY